MGPMDDSGILQFRLSRYLLRIRKQIRENFVFPFGICSSLDVPTTARPKMIASTSQVTNRTCPCTVNPPISQYRWVPTSTAANEKKHKRKTNSK